MPSLPVALRKPSRVSKSAGTINNQVAKPLSLAEAVAEIQQLLEQLAQTNPTATPAEQTTYLNIAIPSNRRQRLISAFQAAGGAALDEIPYGPVGSWLASSEWLVSGRVLSVRFAIATDLITVTHGDQTGASVR